MNEKKTDLFLLRSTYFNSHAGKEIPQLLYYINLPTEHRDKLVEKENLEDFVLHTYTNAFSTDTGVDKIKSDFEEYYYELDKRKFME